MSNRSRNAYLLFVLIALAVGIGVAGAAWIENTSLPPSAPGASIPGSEPAPAADTAPVAPAGLEQLAAAESTPPVQGAPIDGSPAAPPVQGAPIDGSPAGADGTSAGDPAEGMMPTRVIPKESWDLLNSLEKKEGDVLTFEKTKDGKFTKATFAALGSFVYEVPDPDEIRASADPTKPPKDQIPGTIKALNDEPVVVVGFMVPIDVDREGRIKSFALSQNQMFCCFGVPPAMNEWIMVNMEEGKTADFIMDLPVAAFGKLHVGEEIEDGYVLSLYRMTAGEVMDVRELLKRANGV